MKIVAIDFDGVLHRYSGSWKTGEIYDTPTTGAREFIDRIRRAGCHIVILTTRGQDRETFPGQYEKSQKADVEAWLDLHEIQFDEVWDKPWKPFYHVLIDDRAIRFEPFPLRSFKALIGGMISTEKNEAREWNRIESELERLGIIRPGEGEEPA